MQLRSVFTLAGFLVGTVAFAVIPTFTTTASGRLLYDSNLFLQNPTPLAAGQTQIGAPARVSATAVDATASVGLTWKGSGSSLDLGYMPEAIRYVNHGSENHTDHALTLGAATSVDSWTAELKARYLYVDGATNSPIYNALGGTPAVGGEPVRARRAQAVGRASGGITRTLDRAFVRGVFSVFDQQFHTREDPTFGYCNYADRDESSAGVDGGWRAFDHTALVVGARTGFQRQANTLGTALNFSNTFTRWLIGTEGSPMPTLKLAVLAGPEVHRYGESVRPGFDREQRTGYMESTATWTPTGADSVAFTGKRYLWVSGGGRSAYADLLADLNWRHRLDGRWTSSAGANLHTGDTSHFNPWAPRVDRIYTTSAGVSRALPEHTHLDLDVMHDWGVSQVSNTPGREYQRWIVSTTLARSW